MNSALLLIPVFLIRYGLLLAIDKSALQKAAHFPPMRGAEKILYLLYQAATLAFVIYMFFLKIRTSVPWLYVGPIVYAWGLLLLIWSVIGFAKPEPDGICRNGPYRFSRNPMYVAYFICFCGCALFTRSIILFLILCIFQVSAHWIILSEERWCVDNFGAAYTAYMRTVRRYI